LKERSMRVELYRKAPRLAGVGLSLACALCALVADAAWADGDLSHPAVPWGAIAGARAALPAPTQLYAAAGAPACEAALTAARGTGTASPGPSESPIEIPLPRIGRKFRTQARLLIDSPTVFRRLPARRFIADKRTFDYLLDHLPVASRLSDILGYGYYRVVQEEDGRFHARDFQGVEGDIWLIYSDPNKRVYLGEGSYDTWYTPKISAEVLLAVEYGVVGADGRRRGAEAEGGRGGAGGRAPARVREGLPERSHRVPPPPIVTRVDIYVQTSRLVGYLMELLGQVTDKKLSQLVSSAQRTSQELSRRPERVWAMMKESGMFTPEELEDVRRALLAPEKR
jgi:hypothetical protein